MERANLGQTGLRVPTVGMGTLTDTSTCMGRDEEQARREVVDAALSAGANFFELVAHVR